MMYNICVIGVGTLGKRHLESLLNSKLELNVYCYDINKHALDDFKWDSVGNKNKFNMVTSFETLPREIDFALFAMTSKGRREMFDQLVNQCTVKNILFEKVLFQNIEDYEYVGRKLKELNIKAWVNCARRQMDSYQELRKKLEKAKEMRISISGSEWGLACNTIHQLDLVEFLSGSEETVIDRISFLPEIAESKRRGFKEVYGTIVGHSGKCKSFSINCMKGSDVPLMVTISTDIGQYVIFEGKQKLISMSNTDGYDIIEEEFSMPYQSQMTQYVLEDILLLGKSRLSTFDVSSRLHLVLIEPLIKFFMENGWENESCPIT